MVGFPANPAKTVEEELDLKDQDAKVKPFEHSVQFPSIYSYLDFDSCTRSNRKIEDFQDPDFDFFDDDMKNGEEADDVSGEVGVNSIRSESMDNVKNVVCDVKESEPVVASDVTMVEPGLKKTDEGLDCSIEVGLKKVTLDMKDDENTNVDKGKTDSDESDSETSSSSSSDSSSSDEEESDEGDNNKEKKFEDYRVLLRKDDVIGELEEGEIGSVNEEDVDDENEDDDEDDDEVNEMVAWSNDEDDDLGVKAKEPIRSKNELKDLPPVPPVDVTLEPHHVTQPVGVVSSIMSTQVIVEGMEKHSPLTEGSILWITEKKTPLGLVDEIFGPVKCPYYIVRFNSESEVPEGISQGTPVSFVADFAQHILNLKELQTKGYDASGDNDEEIPDELEFSDDEKEDEYRRMQKEKRGIMSGQKTGNTRNKKKSRDFGRPTRSYSGESGSISSDRSDHQSYGPHMRPQMDGFPPNNAGWRPQSNQHNPYQLPPIPNQMGMPNLAPMHSMAMQNQNQMMFQPQFNAGQMPLPGGPGGPGHFFPGQAPAPWPPLAGLNCFSQMDFSQLFGMGHGVQQQQPLPNDPSFNLFSQGPQNPPQSQMLQPQFQMMHRPQPPMNPQFQMQPQSDMRPQSQIPQSPTNLQSPVQPQSQGFNSGRSSERGRGFRGRGRSQGRFGRGRGRGRQQS